MDNKSKRWADSEDAQLKADYSNTVLSQDYFENTYGRSWSSVKVHARCLGLTRGKPEIIRSVSYNLPTDVVLDLYTNQGLSCRAIAKKFNCSFPTISALLKTNSVGVKSNSETVKKYTFNEDYFEKIDSHEKAYFLGWIAANGGVSDNQWALSFGIKKDDIELLENFKKALGSDHPIVMRIMPSNGKKYLRATLYIQGKRFVSHLMALGIGPRKSLTLEFPKIPDEFHNSFMLGYFDGDRSVFTDNKRNMFGFSVISSTQFSQIGRAHV